MHVYIILYPSCGNKPVSARLAVPEKIFGLTLFLDFFDRCGNKPFASSAAGSANALFHLYDTVTSISVADMLDAVKDDCSHFFSDDVVEKLGVERKTNKFTSVADNVM